MAQRSAFWGLLTLALVACAAPAERDDLGDDPAAGGKADGAASGLPGTLHRLELEWAAVPFAPGRPNLIAYVPARFSADEGVNVVVFLHGWYNCVENLARKKNGPCAPRRPAREAFDLPGQLERSGKNAILLLPELAFDEARSEAFAFGEEDTFLWMLWETLAHLDLDLADVTQVIVVSHSGGYKAAAAIASVGGMTVNELWLLDSLYGQEDTFAAWIESEIELFPERARRFANLYTAWGGTLAASTTMATRLTAWFPGGTVLDDRVAGALTETKGRHGVIFKRSHLGHNELVRSAFGELLATSGLP